MCWRLKRNLESNRVQNALSAEQNWLRANGISNAGDADMASAGNLAI